MTGRQGKEYDLTDFDVDDYRPATRRATAATYYFPNLAEQISQAAQLAGRLCSREPVLAQLP
ncbi:hypothetical protein [Streptomyces sp. CMB-StM0423]|uniref:hypothetical protein n=1 Tax=Streptomyces sp. CMB-StM0423 TaxID=2059884 RepID=UPI000C704D30|nr:hypothetical protein [Streptomyces sp. CMB-StM0423]AUH39128.1 hypothetical protein CXR04_01675 [Streptomyces sp. CMB-StM0423]